MTIAEVLAAVSKNNGELDALSTQYARGLVDLTDGLMAWIEQNQGGKSKLLLAKVTLKEMQGVMRAAGLGEYLKPIKGLLAEALDGAEAMVPDGIPLGLSDAALKQAVEGVTLELGATATKVTRQVEGIVREMVTIPTSLRDARERLQASTGILKRHAETVVDTGLAQAQRELHQEAAQAIPQEERLRWYTGPKDGRTRPFCRALEGKALTDSQIGKLKNGQGMSVVTSGGGWRCRHQWIPVSRAWADRNGVELATSADIARANRGAG